MVINMKKIKNGWSRNTSEESGAVVRWYEKGDRVASLVEGDNPKEGQWRIDTGKGSIESRGILAIMNKRTDAQNIDTIETLIRREKYN